LGDRYGAKISFAAKARGLNAIALFYAASTIFFAFSVKQIVVEKAVFSLSIRLNICCRYLCDQTLKLSENCHFWVGRNEQTQLSVKWIIVYQLFCSVHERQ